MFQSVIWCGFAEWIYIIRNIRLFVKKFISMVIIMLFDQWLTATCTKYHNVLPFTHYDGHSNRWFMVVYFAFICIILTKIKLQWPTEMNARSFSFFQFKCGTITNETNRNWLLFPSSTTHFTLLWGYVVSRAHKIYGKFIQTNT